MALFDDKFNTKIDNKIIIFSEVRSALVKATLHFIDLSQQFVLPVLLRWKFLLTLYNVRRRIPACVWCHHKWTGRSLTLRTMFWEHG